MSTTNRILFVTVGTSALTNKDIGEKFGGQSAVVLRDDVSEKFLNRSEEEKPDALKDMDLLRRLVEAHSVYWKQDAKYLTKAQFFRQTSAELTSTHVLLQIAEFDRIVLLCSDTQEGLLAGKVNQRVIQDDWGRLNVEVRKIDGLDARFIDVAESFEALFRDEYHLSKRDKGVVLNVTGGYKGTVVGLTVIAASMGWEIYYQHESQNYASRLLFPEPPDNRIICRTMRMSTR